MFFLSHCASCSELAGSYDLDALSKDHTLFPSSSCMLCPRVAICEVLGGSSSDIQYHQSCDLCGHRERHQTHDLGNSRTRCRMGAQGKGPGKQPNKSWKNSPNGSKQNICNTVNISGQAVSWSLTGMPGILVRLLDL